MKKTIKEMIEVMEWFEGGGDVECVEKGYDDWERVTKPLWNWDDFEYRIKEFQYPMWFKSTYNGLVVRFDSLQSGTVVEEGDTYYKKGEYTDRWLAHTDNEHWEEIEEPKEKPKQKVVIEKWLLIDMGINSKGIKVVVETSDIDDWISYYPNAKKLKLIESYEVEI